MSPFHLVLSEHAIIRIKPRNITRQMIRTCLIRGVLKGLGRDGRKLKTIRYGSKTLSVVYLEIINGYLIVTAYWEKE